MVDIFKLTVDNFEKPSEGSNYKNVEFKPNPNLAKDKIYRCIIRPVYWLENTSKNFLQKTSWYFTTEDGNTSNNNYFDSAFSIGEECPAIKVFFDLKRDYKKGNARAGELAKLIAPKTSFYYLVVVEADIVVPENVGKLMLFKAPKKIHELIQGQINVTEEDKKMGVSPYNIFDPFNGKSIEVKVKVKGSEAYQWNYDDSNFKEKSPVKFNGTILTEDNKAQFIEFLAAGNEMMDKIKYRPLNQERMDILMSIIEDKTGKKINKGQPINVIGHTVQNISNISEPLTETQSKPMDLDSIVNDLIDM